MRQTAAWFLLFVVGLILIDIGITGSLGKVLAVAFAPGLLETTSTTGGAPSQQFYTAPSPAPGGAYPPGTHFGGIQNG